MIKAIARDIQLNIISDSINLLIKVIALIVQMVKTIARDIELNTISTIETPRV